MRHMIAPAVFGTGLCLFATAAAALDQPRIRFGAGIDYSSGDYGRTEATEVISTPLSARVAVGDWSFRASIPYLTIDGPADVVIIDDGATPGAGGGGDPTGTPGAPNHRSGFGDTTLAATYSMNRLGGSRYYLDLIGRVRLPTGSRREGLSSGAVDYGLNAELGRAWRKGGGYVNIGRRFLGDPDPLTRRVDGWQGSVGGWVNTSRKTEVGAYLAARESAFAASPDPAEVGAYVAYRFDRRWRVQLLSSIGLTDGSPDFGTALSVSWRPDGLQGGRR